MPDLKTERDIVLAAVWSLLTLVSLAASVVSFSAGGALQRVIGAVFVLLICVCLNAAVAAWRNP